MHCSCENALADMIEDLLLACRWDAGIECVQLHPITNINMANLTNGIWKLVCLVSLAWATKAPLLAQEPKLRAVLGDGDTRGATTLIWSPDGKLLAALDLDKTVRLWDVASSSN